MEQDPKALSTKSRIGEQEDQRVLAEQLIEIARQAIQFAVAPSSGFRVGAAMQSADRSVFSGCNIESPVYLGICAERVALFKALSEGAREFTYLAVVCEDNVPCVPCGTCRQLLWEFAPTLNIIVPNENGTPSILSILDLLPSPFERGERNPFRK